MHFSITLNYAYQHNIRFYQIYPSDNIMIYHDLSWFIMIYHDISWYFLINHDISRCIMIYHDISRYIMIYRCFGWSQWQMSLSRQFLSNKTPHRTGSTLMINLRISNASSENGYCHEITLRLPSIRTQSNEAYKSRFNFRKLRR